jgi:hypothetical protein
MKQKTYFPVKRSNRLKQLKPLHVKAIQLHLQGSKLEEISEKTGLTPWWICKFLKSDPARKMIAELNEHFDLEFKSLYTKSIRAIREGLNDPDINVRLKAADKYLKAHGMYREGEKGGDSAEDVIRRVMEMR